MATQTTDQQNALKDAMARAKEIAAKLQQGVEGEGAQKRAPSDESNGEPAKKRSLLDGVDHRDPQVIAQQVANSIARRTNLGPMLVEEVTIPSKIVGLVIGKGGEMINKLQTESGAKVQVAPDPPPEISGADQDRQITVTGNAEAVNKAKALLAEIQSSGKVPDRLLMGMMGNQPGEFSVEMNISKQKVGLIIGKGGETIKNVQERAGCKIVLFQDGAYANAPEKLLRITGEQGAVMYAKQLIQDLLTSKELESMNTKRPPPINEGPNCVEVEVPRAAVGLVIGAKGANIQQLQNETGCRIQFRNEMEGPVKVAVLTGSPQQVASAQEKINEIIRTGSGSGRGQQQQQMNGTPRPQWGGAPGVQGPGGPPVWTPQSSSQRSSGNRNIVAPAGQKKMIIEVPANKCGFVIGKGGETIKFIKSESKVSNIQIDRSIPETSPFRVFTVTGTDEMIQKAVEIIRQKINDPSINAKVEGGGGEPAPVPFGQAPWGAPAPAPWGGQPQQNPQWNQQQWPGQQQQQQQQPGWGAQPPQQPPPQPQPPQQQGVWNPQSQPQQGWNPQQQQQQQQPQPPNQPWNPQQPQPQPQQPQQQPQPPPQQWQQQTTAPQGQWANQQQWGQPQPQGSNPAQINQQAYQQVQSAANVVATADPAQAQVATQAAGGQPDYSAAWALYYQQQQQYYQQLAMQQQPGAVSTGATSSVAATAAVPTQVSSNNPQAQAYTQYQSQYAQYQNQYGQQAPQ